jgi:hypothetical protein
MTAHLSWAPIAALMACGPDAAEIQQMIQEGNRMVKDEIRTELVEADVIESEEERRKVAEAEAALPPWIRSMNFLAQLDGLMDGYSPILSEEVDSTDLLRCTTDFELSEDAELRQGANKLFQEKKAAEKEREIQQAAFEREKWRQYRIDLQWNERMYVKDIYACLSCDYMGGREWLVVASSYGEYINRSTCLSWGRDNGPGGCNGGDDQYYWKLYRSEVTDDFLYSMTESPRVPELMARIESTKVPIPNEFHCLVENAEKAKDSVYIDCKGENPEGTYIVAKGEMRMVHRGDLISVPLAEVKREPSGVLYKKRRKVGGSSTMVWAVSADAARVALVTPATCPTKEEILAGASRPKKKKK